MLTGALFHVLRVLDQVAPNDVQCTLAERGVSIVFGCGNIGLCYYCFGPKSKTTRRPWVVISRKEATAQIAKQTSPSNRAGVYVKQPT
jgi:threonine dehydrogenase-like Zn-dependent dehydrogenase